MRRKRSKTTSAGRWESLARAPKPTVLIAGFTKEAKLILVHQFRFGVEDYTYELPGGNLDDGESAVEAIRREFHEETGYDTDAPFQKVTEGWLYNSAVNTPFIVYSAIRCRKVTKPMLEAVERYTRMRVVEQSIARIAREISKGNRAYDPTIAHALVALVAQGKVAPFALAPEIPGAKKSG